jgi:hypothetical protein
MMSNNKSLSRREFVKKSLAQLPQFWEREIFLWVSVFEIGAFGSV